MKKELLTIPEHMSSPPDVSGVHVVEPFSFCIGKYRTVRRF
jgi:hypothetical protein